MTLKSKICGVSDSRTLNFLINHIYSPELIGFIVNYPKSKRFVKKDKLEKLLKIDKKKSFYVAVLIDPNDDTLENIKDLPFDYYQLYNCSVCKVNKIKEKYKKKIIVALTIENEKDVKKYVF